MKFLMPDDSQKLSTEELDRDYAEICTEIDFLEAQINSGRESYPPDELEVVFKKILEFKVKRDLLKLELEK